jgi:hypothetical protein
MPITGGVHTGTNAAAKLSTIVSRRSFKQVDLKANPDNAANVCIGGASVATDGTDTFIVLSADADWGTKSIDAEDLLADWDSLYVVASTGDLLHLVVVS